MRFPTKIVQAAISETGFVIEQPLRTRLEDSFGVSLGHLRIHSGEGSLRANRALGSLAFALDHHICLSRGFDHGEGPMFTWIVAHETAHVLQKDLARRRMRAALPAAVELEDEADQAACHVLLGKRVSRLTPDPAPVPRYWGPAGHYYTVFLASMMAGLPLEDCKSNAFYAQMPDQVTELDAIPAGTDWCKRLFHAWSNWNTDNMVTDAQVQIGLHSLSGWAAKAETAYRKKILDKLDNRSFEFGLALHSFGDSYAHRVLNGGERMYKAPVGHLVEADVKDATVKHLLNGAHRPDKMELRPELYREYGLALYDMFLERWQIRMDEGSKQDRRRRFEACLDAISGQTDEDTQIQKIWQMKDYDGGLSLGMLNSYYPESDDEVPWDKFVLQARLNGQGLSPDLLDRALSCAADWSRGIAVMD